jgi:hypothetical protein
MKHVIMRLVILGSTLGALVLAGGAGRAWR